MIAETLMRYGYTQKQANKLAKEIQHNLDNYIQIQERVRKEQDVRLRTVKQPNSRGLLESLNRKRNNGR
jgi:hypothetical protein